MIQWILLITALSVSAVAAWYSIAGLAAIFAAAVIPVIIMGGVLEVGKLVAVTYLHRFWTEAPKLLRAYLVFAVAFLMFITSMGIFGFLSKAHIEQTATVGDNSVQIARIDGKIQRQQRAINDAEKVIGQLDDQVQKLIDYDRIRGPSGSIATRAAQGPERDQLALVITNAENQIDKLQEEKLVLDKEQIAIEAEVGPIKYIAELIYGEADRDILEQSVRWVIIILVIVFDPLAVALLVAWNDVIKRGSPKKIKVNNTTPEIPVPNELEQLDDGSYRKRKKKAGAM